MNAATGAQLLVGIAALMVGEGLALSWLWRRRGVGIPPAVLAVNLLAGMSLMLAAAVAALGYLFPWLPLCLLVALVAHVADLRMRWQRR